MLEQSSLALVGEMPIAAAPAKKASNLAIDLTLSPLPDGLEHAVQNAAARRPGGSLWQVCGIVADGEVMVPGNGIHGLSAMVVISFVVCAPACLVSSTAATISTRNIAQMSCMMGRDSGRNRASQVKQTDSHNEVRCRY
jgi:hypothetical protein